MIVWDVLALIWIVLLVYYIRNTPRRKDKRKPK
jgi:hypothetical protein